MVNPTCDITLLNVLHFRMFTKSHKSILENVTYPKISSSLIKTFNTTGAPATIHRWKQKEAEKYSFHDIIKALKFSSALSIDEYKPKRSKHYDLIAGDAKKVQILYMESATFSARHAGLLARGDIEGFCHRLKEFGINPPML